MNYRRKRLIRHKVIIMKCILSLIKSKPRRWWVHPLWKNRKIEGDYYTLVIALFRKDPVYFKKYLRVTPEEFIFLRETIKPYLIKNPKGRKALTVGHRLAITLRYLASGDSLASISFAFRIGFTTTARIVRETCNAIWISLNPIYLNKKSTEEWEEISKEYYKNWNFPNCVGAVDGKHVLIQSPPNSGSLYYNYKGSFSIVLMAIVDANYKFIAVDVGGYGSVSDSGTLQDSELGRQIYEESIGFPENSVLPLSNLKSPYVLVGDEAFQLRKNFMRPFPGKELTNEKRIFNYRLSRARRCVENAFGVMASRFRIFRKPIILHPNTTDVIVKGYADTVKENGIVEDGMWRSQNSSNNAFKNIGNSTRNFKYDAKLVRDNFVKYFNSEAGAVSWQNNIRGIYKS